MYNISTHIQNKQQGYTAKAALDNGGTDDRKRVLQFDLKESI
jgi:hypothetical protein